MEGKLISKKQVKKEDKRELLKSILREVDSGGSVTEILKKETKICRATFYNWIDQNQDLKDQYKVINEKKAELCILEAIKCMDLDNITDEEFERFKKHKVNGIALITHLKNKAQLLTWIAEKLNPEKYGNKLKVDSTNTSITSVVFQEKT